MSGRVAASAAAEWRAHWSVVAAACAGMGLATIAMYTTSLFIEPLEAEFGWTRAEIMSGYVLTAVVGVVCAPLIGIAVDRFGPRRIGIAASITAPIAFAMLGLTNDNIWVWRALWGVFALSTILLQPAIWTSAVTAFFSTGRGFALACTLCGSGLSSIAMPLLTYEVIERFGWRIGFAMIALFWFLIVFPLVIFFFTSPQDRDRISRSERSARISRDFGYVFRTMILSRRFFQVAFAGLFIATVVVSIVITLVPILTSNGISRGTAASIAGTLGFTSIAGRLAVGYLLDHVQARFLAAIMLCMPVVAIILLLQLPQSVPAAMAAVMILGLALGAELDLLAYITSRYFDLNYFGTLFGTIGGFVSLAGGAGPLILNLVYDMTGSYVPALLAAIPICLAAALLFLLLGPYPENLDASSQAH
ncbi:MAG: MFS transporter [Sphingomonadaceae bacterium]|nr:MFS transporter [Sphingomonadaceae bacterium]